MKVFAIPRFLNSVTELCKPRRQFVSLNFIPVYFTMRYKKEKRKPTLGSTSTVNYFPFTYFTYSPLYLNFSFIQSAPAGMTDPRSHLGLADLSSLHCGHSHTFTHHMYSYTRVFMNNNIYNKHLRKNGSEMQFKI